MAAKNPHGSSVYDLLIDIIFNLTPNQAERLYNELLPRFTKRAKTSLYNRNGEEDNNGKVRLLPYQYKAIRTKFGDTYVKKAFAELTDYIEFLEKNQDVPEYKSKLKTYNSRTHNLYFIERGWVYEKNKQYIITERPKVAINPFLIEDFATAKEYIKSIPNDMRNSVDVQMLLVKFPELIDVEYEQQ